MTFVELLEKYCNSPDGYIRLKKAVCIFLLKEKPYANLISHVWLWDDFPYKDELSDICTGSRIDIIAQTHEGGYWLMRCEMDGMSFDFAKQETDRLPLDSTMVLSADDAIKSDILNSQVNWEIIDKICAVKAKREVVFPDGKFTKPERQLGKPLPCANPSQLHKCEICKRKTHDMVRNDKMSCHVCIRCRIRQFGSTSDEEIVDIVTKAKALTLIEKIGMIQAIDAVMGKTAIAGIKEKTATKEPLQIKCNHRNCRICRSATINVIGNRTNSFYICDNCGKYYFNDLWSSEGKVERLMAAIKIANEEKISLSFALNVERGLYSLEEAKRRMSIKKKELKGSSTDIFIIGKRMPGSYK